MEGSLDDNDSDVSSINFGDDKGEEETKKKTTKRKKTPKKTPKKKQKKTNEVERSNRRRLEDPC